MSEYSPDAWVLLRLTDKGSILNRIFAGWYGGYLGGDSWKLSSGVTKIVKVNSIYEVHNESGSIYRCHEHCERMTGYQHSVLSNWVKQAAETNGEVTIEVIKLTESGFL